MDRWPAYISATLEHVPGAEGKIRVGPFHDEVRRQEHAELAVALFESVR